VDVPAPLERRVGPFPLVGWLAIGLAGIGLGLLIRRSGLFNNKPEPELEQYDEDGNPIIPAAAGAQFVPSGVANAGGASSSTSSSSSTPAIEDTNAAWARRAIAWLLSNGANPSDADAGIRKYLEGAPLTGGELAAVQRALREPTIGIPPEYVPPPQQLDSPPVAPPPPPSPVTPPPTSVSIDPSRAQLVSDDGNTVLLWDGNAVQWVQDGNRSIALWRAGAKVAGHAGAADANSPEAFPVPIRMSRAVIVSAPHKIGPPPPEWGGWG
jgi:hypothetical protein